MAKGFNVSQYLVLVAGWFFGQLEFLWGCQGRYGEQ